jgi:hypothetical protein
MPVVGTGDGDFGRHGGIVPDLNPFLNAEGAEVAQSTQRKTKNRKRTAEPLAC